MFGFWKKKGGEVPEEQQWQRSAEQRAKERQQAAEIPQALRTLGQDFLPEELEILAVTGANPFSGSQGEEGEGLWPASIGLTAWIEADGPELHRGAFQLETIADNQLMPVLRQRARPDFIIRFRARRSEDGRLRACAARDLLELANDWASDGGCEEHEPEEITREQFMERLEPDAVQISGDGSFDFWFNDGALFWGHSIHVTGSLEGGPEKAEMEG